MFFVYVNIRLHTLLSGASSSASYREETCIAVSLVVNFMYLNAIKKTKKNETLFNSF